MNKITLSVLALSLMATGAFASQRNNDETAARMFFMDDVATSSEAFAVAGGSDGSAYAAHRQQSAHLRPPAESAAQ